jgi:hypothetical protein
MADEENKPTFDAGKFAMWVGTKGQDGGSMRCPMCNGDQFQYSVAVTQLFGRPYSSRPVVEMWCANCGLTMWFNAETVGLSPQSPGGESDGR